MTAPRGPNGELPDLGNYWKLASTSDLIDAGIDVGLPFKGNAPDLGPFEYTSQVASVFDNWTEYTYPTITGTVNTSTLVSTINTYITNLETNYTELKVIVEDIFTTTLTWDNRDIVVITNDMRAMEIRNTLNTNNEILFANMTELYDAIDAFTIIDLDADWNSYERNVLIAPSSQQFIRNINWNTSILSSNLYLMYELLNIEYGN